MVAITGGVLAGPGELSHKRVIAAAAIGAFAGDSSAYLIGRGIGRRRGSESSAAHARNVRLRGLLGYYGGRVFEEQPHLALAVPLGIASP
jgi:hypothetical protein